MNTAILLILLALCLTVSLSYTLLSPIRNLANKISLKNLITIRNYLNSDQSIIFTYPANILQRKKYLSICFEDGCLTLNVSATIIYWREPGFKREYNATLNRLWQIYGNTTVVGLASGVEIQETGDVIKVKFVSFNPARKTRTSKIFVTVRPLKTIEVASLGRIKFDNLTLYSWWGYKKIVIIEEVLST